MILVASSENTLRGFGESKESALRRRTAKLELEPNSPVDLVGGVKDEQPAMSEPSIDGELSEFFGSVVLDLERERRSNEPGDDVEA